MRLISMGVLLLTYGCGDMWIAERPQVWDDDTSGITLHWQNASASGTYSWSDASSYCNGLEWAGESGWRVPTVGELRSLIRGCASNKTTGPCGVTDSCLGYTSCYHDCESCTSGDGPGMGGCYWDSELSGTCGGYWSSSAVEGSASDRVAWHVIFDQGHVDYDDQDNEYRVRCVRSSAGSP